MGVGSDGRPIEGATEGHRDARSMCFRRFDAGPVSALTILPAASGSNGVCIADGRIRYSQEWRFSARGAVNAVPDNCSA